MSDDDVPLAFRWIAPGACCDYRARIGGPILRRYLRVATAPVRLAGDRGPWVCTLEGVPGGVFCAALSPSIFKGSRKRAGGEP